MDGLIDRWQMARLRATLRVNHLRGRYKPEPTYQELRELFDVLGAMTGLPDGFDCESVDVAGVPGEWMRAHAPMAAAGAAPAAEATDCVLLYLHGGGYFMGSIEASRKMVSLVLPHTGGNALNIDYRLAPEHPFPAAVDDALAAYRWLLESGIDPGRVVLCGDSAGGGLAIATLVAARDAGDPMPAGCAVTSAWADLAGTGDSYAERARRDPALVPRTLRLAGEAYGRDDLAHPLASPVYADLVGLPPLLIMVGEHEIVYDDSATLSKRAVAAGVATEFFEAPRMIHCWTGYADTLPSARRDLARLGAFVQRVTAGVATDSTRATP